MGGDDHGQALEGIVAKWIRDRAVELRTGLARPIRAEAGSGVQAEKGCGDSESAGRLENSKK
jgi:hypothetical protein